MTSGSGVITLYLLTTFRTRLIEWLFAYVLLGWGLDLLFFEPELFSKNVSYANFLTFWTQTTWGWTCLALGTVRVVVLIVNGTFPRYTLFARGVLAALSAMVWMQVVLAFNNDVVSTADIVYLGFFVFEFFIMVFAIHFAPVSPTRGA